MKLLIVAALFALATADFSKSKVKESVREQKALAMKVKREYDRRKEKRAIMEGGSSARLGGKGRAVMKRLEAVITKPKEDVDSDDIEDYETGLVHENLRSEHISYRHDDGKQYNVYSVIGEPKGEANATILFLHSSQHTHVVWYKSGILQTLQRMGYKVVAIDLPAKGRTGNKRPAMASRGDWLLGFMKAANLEKPVLVSPAMSGTYAVPAMLKQPEAFTAWIAISPSGVRNTTDWSRARVPTLAMYGEKDLLGNLLAANMFTGMPSLIRFRASGHGTHFYEKSPRTFLSRVVLFLHTGLDDLKNNLLNSNATEEVKGEDPVVEQSAGILPKPVIEPHVLQGHTKQFMMGGSFKKGDRLKSSRFTLNKSSSGLRDGTLSSRERPRERDTESGKQKEALSVRERPRERDTESGKQKEA